MGKPADRDPSYMRATHGTTKLITDYDALKTETMKIAREGIENYHDALVSLASGQAPTNSLDLAGSLRNSDDYDDWEYGTEPIPGDPTWTTKPSS